MSVSDSVKFVLEPSMNKVTIADNHTFLLNAEMNKGLAGRTFITTNGFSISMDLLKSYLCMTSCFLRTHLQ